MTRGFYSATAAMMADVNRFETVANNLANVNTHGFKRHQTLHHDFQEGFVERVQAHKQRLSFNQRGELVKDLIQDSPREIGEMGTGTFVMGNWTHYDQGALQQTENPLDLALKGDGFFTVAGPDGNPRYTRNGHFKLNEAGQLVNADGLALLGQRGTIEIDPRASLSIGADGQVFENGQVIDQLQLVNFEQPQLLVNQGGNLYSALPGMQSLDTNAEVAQGYLEQSNVDVAGEMIQMISALRSYQISQKALQSEDEMSARLINDVGRVMA